LVPGFHSELWRAVDEDRVVVNIGGIANITFLPADLARPVSAFDTGPGNCLLDEWISLHRATRFDRDGAWAAAGVANADLLGRMLADPYFLRGSPKSTGRDHFNVSWFDDSQISPADVQATLVDLTAKTVVDAIRPFARQPRLLICGGGAFNNYLLKRLARFAGELEVETTTAFGVEPDRVEACAFAWLARLRLERQVAKVDISGARKKVPLGGVYLAN
jgi:anhydro-N-acetylmuramic acid kinase